MVDTLTEKTCTPCKGGIPPLTGQEAERFRGQVPQWELHDDAKRIERKFKFRNFGEALKFVQEARRTCRTRSTPPGHQLRLGLRHGEPADQEDQRPARERFHPSGQDRSAGVG